MAIDPSSVGRRSAAQHITWTHTDALLYAISVGAGVDELAYTTENTADIRQLTLATFPLVLPGGDKDIRDFGTYDDTDVVHGSQSITLHRPLPVEGEALVVGEVVGAWDKGTAAVVELTGQATTMDGQPLYSTVSSLFIRGAGGWGGARGPGRDDSRVPSGAPDLTTTEPTSAGQALLYRLNGDRTPLHSDPAVARAAGFERPILHGLCTYGFAVRAVMNAFADGDATRIRYVAGRFAAPVEPGDALTTLMWRVGGARVLFEVMVGERRVMDQGVVELTAG